MLFKPFYSFNIKVVCRFVKQQQVRRRRKSPCDCRFFHHAARHCTHLLVKPAPNAANTKLGQKRLVSMFNREGVFFFHKLCKRGELFLQTFGCILLRRSFKTFGIFASQRQNRVCSLVQKRLERIRFIKMRALLKHAYCYALVYGNCSAVRLCFA